MFRVHQFNDRFCNDNSEQDLFGQRFFSNNRGLCYLHESACELSNVYVRIQKGWQCNRFFANVADLQLSNSCIYLQHPHRPYISWDLYNHCDVNLKWLNCKFLFRYSCLAYLQHDKFLSPSCEQHDLPDSCNSSNTDHPIPKHCSNKPVKPSLLWGKHLLVFANEDLAHCFRKYNFCVHIHRG